MTGVNCRTTSRPAAEWYISNCCERESTVAVLTYDSVEVKSDPYLVAIEVLVVVTFAWRSVVCPIDRPAEHAGDVQVHESGKSESEQGSCKDEPFQR
jgi:hypothetical protein